MQMMMIMCFALLAPPVDAQGLQGVGWLICGMFGLTIFVLVGVGMFKVVSRFFKAKLYAFFLTHHKLAAGLFARQMKGTRCLKQLQQKLQEKQTGKSDAWWHKSTQMCFTG